MYPVHATDAQVRAVMRELTRDGRLPTGSQLRAELQRRFASRGGVARIYRLLREAGAAGAPRSAEVTRELDAARERAQLAEHREEAHQRMWLREIDQLRTRLAEAERFAQQGRLLEDQNRELRRRLQSAELRLGEFERQRLKHDGQEPAG